jgi:FixJ family two-component response regulator
MISTATVFIVDDDLSVLKSLGRLVSAAGFNVAAFNSASEFLNRPKDDTPACMVLDMQMPELGGFDLQQRLSADGWKLPIIFLTGHGDIPASVRAIKAGAVDFLTKPCEDGELLAAIDQAIAQDLDARRVEADMAELRNRFALLTQREQEVFAHVVAGHLNKQIAYDLGTCEQTIKVHRMRITEKLQVRSLADLARLAEKIGMTPLAPINQIQL